MFGTGFPILFSEEPFFEVLAAPDTLFDPEQPIAGGATG
jgi:hypothetical protein